MIRLHVLTSAAVVISASLLFTGCGETGEETSETEETETPIEEATGIEIRAVPEAGVDIVWKAEK